MTNEQISAITTGRTRATDRQGTVWVIESVYRARTHEMVCGVRCVMPSPEMSGLSIGCISERPACVLEMEGGE